MPDFVTNSGGVAGIAGIGALGWSRVEAEDRVRGFKRTFTEILTTAEEGITPEAATPIDHGAARLKRRWVPIQRTWATPLTYFP